MRILARYLSEAFIKNFIFSALGLTALYLFQDLLGELLASKYPASQVVFYRFMELPQIFVRMAPPSVLMATVLTLSGLTRTNELTAMFSIGVGLKQVMSVILSVVFMICCFMVFLQDRILPPVFRKQTVFYHRDMMGRSDFYIDIKQDKIWYRSANLIYNLRRFDPKSQKILGMSVYTFDDDFRLVQLLDAKEAVFNGKNWELMNGTVTIFSGEDWFPVSKGFERKTLMIEERPSDFQEIEKEVEGLRIKELYQYIQKTKETGVDTRHFEVKFHYRISLSFIPLIMCMLAVPFSVRRSREGGVVKDLGICLAITFFYWIFYSVGLSLGENGMLPPLVAGWAPSVVFGFLAVLLLTRKNG